MELLIFRPQKFEEMYGCNYTLPDSLITDRKLLSSFYFVIGVILLVSICWKVAN